MAWEFFGLARRRAISRMEAPAETSGETWCRHQERFRCRSKRDGFFKCPWMRGEEAPNDASPLPKHDVETATKLLGKLAKLDIPAVKKQHLVLINSPTAHLPGTSMIQLADELAEILRGWAKDQH